MILMNEVAKDSSSELQWYAVHAYSNYEEKVKERLREHIRLKKKESEFGRIEVLTETVVELREGKQKKVSRKAFPGYVFVQMKWSEENWHLVRSTPKVLGFIGGDQHRPEPIPEEQVQAILAREEEDKSSPRVKVVYEPGQVIRVIDGPFKDFSGVVEEANHEKGRMRVAIQIFGRATPVELNFKQVAKD